MKKEMRQILREGVEEWRNEIAKMMEEMKNDSEMLKNEMRDWKRREEEWRREGEEMRGAMKELEKRMEKIEKRREDGKERREIVGERDLREMESRMKGLEWRLEKEEREKRRKNIIIKGLEVKEGRRKEAVEELMKLIGVTLEARVIWKISDEKEKGREMIGCKVEDEELRKEIWRNKKILKGRKERIERDWTWKQRRMRWKLEEIARGEERKGKKVWVEYGRIRIEEQWWKWEEEREYLTDGMGRIWGEEEKGKKGKEG